MLNAGCSMPDRNRASNIQHQENLERNVVARRWAAGGHVLLRFVVLRLVAPSATAAATAARTAPAAFARAEHLQPFADDFQLRVLLPFFFPAIELQAAFDQNGRALAEIFVCDFCSAPPERDIDKRGFVDPL